MVKRQRKLLRDLYTSLFRLVNAAEGGVAPRYKNLCDARSALAEYARQFPAEAHASHPSDQSHPSHPSIVTTAQEATH